LHSRCQGRFHIEKSDINEFTARAATILISENIKFDLDTLDTYVKATYPDLRKCINEIELNSMSGTLIIDNTSEGSADYKIEMVQLFKAGRINEARKLICKQARPEEIEDIYRWLYDNIELFGDDGLQDKAILIIKDGLVNHTIIADPEINLSATLIRLANI
jgi:DNA polymerase III delta prime subunit